MDRLVGVMRVCDEFVEEIDLTIGEMAAHCDSVCFLTHHVTAREVLRAMSRCRDVAATAEYNASETNGVWCQYRSLDQAYHLANGVEADWVVMQDQDELLPWAHLRRGIEDMKQYGGDAMFLPPIHCWESPHWIVWPRLNQTGWHCKVYRGHNANFTACHSGGFCAPGIPHVPFSWPYPYRHLGFMTQTARRVRTTVAPGRSRREAWSEACPPIHPFRADWTINEFDTIAKGDCIV